MAYGGDDLSSLLRQLNCRWTTSTFGGTRTRPITESQSSSTSNVNCAFVAGVLHQQSIAMKTLNVHTIPLDLPSNVTTVDSTYYQEVSMPPVEPLLQHEMSRIVPRMVNNFELKMEHRNVFNDYRVLNPVQSAAYDVAYNSDENILVCAPTGSGKTNIALLCILREIGHFKSIAKLKIASFKIVYVAPMKALAAEVVANFRKRLGKLHLVVREFTGDMHLYAEEIDGADILVTTPEKWDAVTRRNTGESSLFRAVHLLILDEVHILNCDRGPVLEAVVARTFRLRNSKASRLRIVGLSATLPNYSEVAKFLQVDLTVGLFYFNWGFRPIPLKQSFVGAKFSRAKHYLKTEDDVCYTKVVEFLKLNKQVLIFVHSRGKTMETAEDFIKRAGDNGDSHLFLQIRNSSYYEGVQTLQNVTLRSLKHFYEMGIAVHHAGMLRDDREVVEQLFQQRMVKVLISTATLAWGVNLPAYAVIIKGTKMYNPTKGSLVNVDLLDIQQMFGRAGRPQFDTTGEAIVITADKDLPNYLSLLTWQLPIQSQFQTNITDHLNAEVVLKTVTSIAEGVEWLKSTFLYIRMQNQPEHYGVSLLTLEDKCRQLIRSAASELVDAKMITCGNYQQNFDSTEIGRIASHTYINHTTIKVINRSLKPNMTMRDILQLLCTAKELEETKSRPKEQRELLHLNQTYAVEKIANSTGSNFKVSILLQTFLVNGAIENTSLYLDQAFFVRNAKRILRAVFEMVLHYEIADSAKQVLDFRKALEHKLWPTKHPIYQMTGLDQRSLEKIGNTNYSLTKLKSLHFKQLRSILGKDKSSRRVEYWLHTLPLLNVNVNYHRMTPFLVRLELDLIPDFSWDDKINHESLEPFILWVENKKRNKILIWEDFVIQKRQVEKNKNIRLEVNLLHSETSVQEDLILRVQSVHWLGVECVCILSHEQLTKPCGALPLFQREADMVSVAYTEDFQDYSSSESD